MVTCESEMTIDIAKANAELRDKPALEIVRWAIAQANGRAIVSTNFRPYEAVILHLCVQVQPDIGPLGGPRIQSARDLQACGGTSKAPGAEHQPYHPA